MRQKSIDPGAGGTSKSRQDPRQVVGRVDVYLMSGLLVFIAVCFTVLWACLHQRISVEKTLVLFAYIFLCWYVAAVLKAQGGRDRMKL